MQMNLPTYKVLSTREKQEGRRREVENFVDDPQVAKQRNNSPWVWWANTQGQNYFCRPTNGLYTPKSREGVLPSCVVVIPDTMKSMYSVEWNDNVFDLYAIGSQKKKEPGETSIPFIHGVELSGPKGETVRFWSVFNDGVLANAIDEKMYLMSKCRLSVLKRYALSKT